MHNRRLLTSDPYLHSSNPETKEMLMPNEKNTHKETDDDNAHESDEDKLLVFFIHNYTLNIFLMPVVY